NRIPANQPGMFENGSYGEGWNGVNPAAQTEIGGVRRGNNPYAVLNASLNYMPFSWLEAEVTAAPKVAASYDNNFIRAMTTYNANGSVAFVSPAIADLT